MDNTSSPRPSSHSDAGVYLHRDFERKILGYTPSGPTDDTVLLLEQMFKHLPSEGKQNLVEDVGQLYKVWSSFFLLNY